MNKRQKIALVVIAVIWIWIGLGGPYGEQERYFGSGLGYQPDFTKILRAWFAMLIPSGVTIYLLKDHN